MRGTEETQGNREGNEKENEGGMCRRQWTGRRVTAGIRACRQLALNLYAAVLLVILPLTLKDKYSGVGSYKYELFREASKVFLPGLLALYCIGGLWELWAAGRAEKADAGEGDRQGEGGRSRNVRALLRELRSKGAEGFRKSLKGYRIIDLFVMAYFISVLFSFMGAENKEFAFYGSDGWFMGLLSQLFFIGIYFVVSRMWSTRGTVWCMACGGAFLVFACGVLHRFNIDPIGVYPGLTEDQKLQFLSTLGQATWYSSYVCTVFPLGLYLFWKSDKIWIRLLSGVFAATGFATIVTQNSDSAFMALAAVLVLLLYLAFDSSRNMGRLLEVLLLMLFSFEAVGLLQNQFSGRAMQLDALSEFASQSIVTGVLLIVLCAVYFRFSLKGFRFMESQARLPLRRIVMLFILFLIVGVIFFIAANTAGILGGEARGGYLYFDESWGSGRGKTWKFTMQAFLELPLWRKLIGVGPDCYADYFYGIPRYEQQLRAMWGGDILTNSHNEWMNAVINYGLIGGAAYLGIFIGAIREFMRSRTACPGAVACGLCLAAYMAHNIFCYQQVLCTPYAFWILGMGSALLRRAPVLQDPEEARRKI